MNPRTAVLEMNERKHPACHGVDRLSALPDALLHCVMSYLTARQAVQTCKLSRRWRNLWQSAPCLDVVLCKNEMRWEGFKNFATKLLQHHSAPVLDRFQLRISTYQHVQADIREQVVKWILQGASYRPATIEISLESAATYVRMPPLGTSSRLTRLCLSGVLLDGGFADCLRTGCPVLQRLEVHGCALEDFEEIVSSTLKSLTFYNCNAKRRPYDEKWRVRVTAPCLVSIAIGNGWQNVIILSTLLLSPQVNKTERVVSTNEEIMLMIL